MTNRPLRRRRRRAPLVAGLAVAALLLAGCEFVPLNGAPNCRLTPANSVWRSNVKTLPTHASSDAFLTTIGKTNDLKADFGSGTWEGFPIGIPYAVVPGSQPKVPIVYDQFGAQSDPGPMPIPPSAPVEGDPNGGGDRHVLIQDKDSCKIYELYATRRIGGGTSWTAGSGVDWDASSNAMRPAGWTSADAAGLPILPGLVRYEEVAAGKVLHAIRVTVPVTRTSYVWPASHQAGSTSSTSAPPMGTWLRLKASINPNDYPPQTRPIIVALQTYGAIIADNGSALYMSGVPDARWDNDQLQELRTIQVSDFVVVDASSMKVANGSYESNKAS